MKRSKYNLRAIFEEMEIYLLASMKRNLSRHLDEEVKQGFKFEQWQAAKLRDIYNLRRESAEIIDSYSTEIKKTIGDTIKSSFNRASRNMVNFFKRVIKKGDIPPKMAGELLTLKEGGVMVPVDLKPTIDGLSGDDLKNKLQSDPKALKEWTESPRTIEESFFRTNPDRLKSLTDSVEGEIRQAQSSIMRKIEDTYRETIYKAHVYHNTGTMTARQAIDMATKDFLAKGINSITYSNGKSVNIASYAEMAIRTARHRAFLAAEGEKRKRLGISTVLTSSHATSCPLCIPWQGKVLIDDVYSGGKPEDGPYTLLSTAMKAGFLHPNCEHNLGTYYEGISSLPEVDPERDIKAREWYKASQAQRALERAIRQELRAIEGSLDSENILKAKTRLKKLRARLRQHIKDNPQTRRKPERERIIGEAESHSTVLG